MEHYVEQVNIQSDKIDDDIKICAFSDLHLKENERDIIYIRSVIKKISELNPDYIAGLGDYYYGHRAERYKMQRSLIYLLHALREIAPVIMSLGNHDLSVKNESELRKSFRDLESNNIYPLDNESVEFDDIFFSGYFEKRDVYAISQLIKRRIEMNEDNLKEVNLK
jgi:predicted MPP superfamily phosphohydrolase